jgi:hypothetical protein
MTNSSIHLPETTLARLQSQAEGGHDDARVLLHLIARADAQDQWFADFTDHYAKTIAALCRRLEALERGAGLRHPVEGDATQFDSVADAAQVDDSPVANALRQAEAALADVAEGEAVSPRAIGCLHWAEARCTEALAAIRPVMKEHGIRTSEFPPAAPAPAPVAPTPPPTALVEVVGNELPLLPDGRVDEARTRAAIHGIAVWLDTCGQHGCSVLLREEIDR